MDFTLASASPVNDSSYATPVGDQAFSPQTFLDQLARLIVRTQGTPGIKLADLLGRHLLTDPNFNFLFVDQTEQLRIVELTPAQLAYVEARLESRNHRPSFRMPPMWLRDP